MKKKGFMRVVLALLMSMLLIVSTGCGKSGNGGSSSGKKSGKTATLADMNEIPEDGIITKEQFKTVAGENKKVQFKGTTDMELHISGRMIVQRFRIRQIRI